MISTEFKFLRPEGVDNALELLREHGTDITILSGGMSLLPMMNLGIVEPSIVLSLNHIPSLDYIQELGDDLVIGAGVRHARVAADPLILQYSPTLAVAAKVIGDIQVRNRGTIGGSIAHADPAADYLPVLATAGAVVRLRSASGERVVPLSEFVVDFMYTTRAPEELLAEVVVPKMPATMRTSYVRLARVEGSFAIVNVAASIDLPAGIGLIAIGGVSTRPVVVDISSGIGASMSRGWSSETVAQAAREASAGASGDIFSDAEYRQHLAAVLAVRAVTEAVDGFHRHDANDGGA